MNREVVVLVHILTLILSCIAMGTDFGNPAKAFTASTIDEGPCPILQQATNRRAQISRSDAPIDESSDSLKREGKSAEMVIGLNRTWPNGCSQLMDLVARSEGKVVNIIQMNGEVKAVVVDLLVEQVPRFKTELQKSGTSRYIEPNRSFQIDFVPNDPYWSQQWGTMTITADFAWNTTVGDSAVLVAVIDTGIDWNHPDLAANYVPLGYDWVNNDADPMDDHGHGTHCAGIIASAINNGIGIAGLAQIRIMAEKSIDHRGLGWEADLANSIVHAVDQGAHILSCSWGGPKWTYSQLLHEVLKYAQDEGVLVIASAGNAAQNLECYPAAYDEVVAVSATDRLDEPWEKTNFGDWIEVAAPGVGVYSTVWDDSYGYMSGTSMSAPQVAGVASLIWSRFPNMTRDQVRAQLRQSADDLGDTGFDIYYGYGRINARNAVEQAPTDHDLSIFNCEIPSYITPEGLAIINTTVLNFGVSSESDIGVQLLVNSSVVDSKFIRFLASGTSTTVSCSWSPTIHGVYNVTAYLAPVLGETVTKNNVYSTRTTVRPAQVIRVPQDYQKIQSAIDNAIPGDTIIVASHTYYENILVNKDNLTLFGEDRNTTIIDGNGTDTVVQVTADYGTISGFTIQYSGKHENDDPPDSGIALCYSTGQVISNTTILNNHVGIHILGATNSTLRNNEMTHNCYNFAVVGYVLSDFLHNIDTSNMVNEKPLYYYVNQHDQQIPVEAGYVAVVNSTQITVKDLNLTQNMQGVVFAYTVDSTIQNVTVSNNRWGVLLIGSKGNHISGNAMWRNKYGIDLWHSKGNTIDHNVISTGEDGIYLGHSNCNTLEGNMVTLNHRPPNHGRGIYLESSWNNTLLENTVFNNDEGVYLAWSGDNTLRANNITDNVYNFGVSGHSLSHFVEDIDVSNVVNSKPIHYLINQKDSTIDRASVSDIGYVGLVNSTNITIKNLELLNNIQGLLLAFVTNSIVENITASNNIDGISIKASINNQIHSNAITSNRDSGICLYSSSCNKLSRNAISKNDNGVCLSACTNNAIDDNLIADNRVSGLTVHGSSNNTISSIIEHNCLGIYLESSNGNFIVRSTIKRNRQYGFCLDGASGNWIYHNNFIDNQNHLLSTTSTNIWDNGCEGNYWSDHNPPDEDKDRIGDSIFGIKENNVDRYPLIYPFEYYELGYTPERDLNGDGIVNIMDVATVAKAYGCKPGDLHWSPIADMDMNETINIVDIAIVALDYGQTV